MIKYTAVAPRSDEDRFRYYAVITDIDGNNYAAIVAAHVIYDDPLAEQSHCLGSLMLDAYASHQFVIAEKQPGFVGIYAVTELRTPEIQQDIQEKVYNMRLKVAVYAARTKLGHRMDEEYLMDMLFDEDRFDDDPRLHVDDIVALAEKMITE